MGIKMSIQDYVLRQKVEEMSLKLNTVFTSRTYLMHMSVGYFTAYFWTKYKLSKVKAVMGAREVKTELLCLYVQIWMDLKRCHC
jgi:hypothetical protein